MMIMMMNDRYILQPPPPPLPRYGRILCTVTTTILFLLSASTTTAASAWLPSSSSLLLLPRKPYALLPSSSQPQHPPIFSSSQHQELDDDENTNHHSNSGCHIDNQLLDSPIRENVLHSPQRRRFWSQRVLPSLFAGLSSSLLPTTQLLPAAATATIFGESNLPTTKFTNRIMEQIRIWEQDEADQMQYHGELERGDAGNHGKVEAYPSLLVPILQIDQQLQHIQQLLVVVATPGSDPPLTAERDDRRRRMDRYTTVMDLLQQPQYDIIAFKRIFNAYADNIYYSDPDRANVYLGGGGTFPLCCIVVGYLYIYILLVPHWNSQRNFKKTISTLLNLWNSLLTRVLLLLFVTATPKSIQSMAYLLRNEILDNINNLRAELQYQISTRTETNQPNDHTDNDNEDDDDDVSRYAQAAYTAMQRYMEIIPPTEIQRAETLSGRDITI
jgi:hypothetical protein